MARYANDPRWITAKYTGICRGCGHKFGLHSRVFYFPLTKQCFCSTCGQAESERFNELARDEDAYNGYGRNECGAWGY